MSRLRWQWRLKLQKRVEEFKVGDIVESCDYHPSRVIEMEWDGVLVSSLILKNKSYGSCSLMHCGVRKLTLGQVWRKRFWYRCDGARGLALGAGWRRPDYDEFVKNWK